MTRLLALLASLKPYAAPVGAFAAKHWRGIGILALAFVALLAMRGCSREHARADGAEAQASAERAQLQAQFDAALGTVRGLSSALSKRLDAEGAPVAVFQGTGQRQIVARSNLPAAPDKAIGPPAASAGTSSSGPAVPGKAPEPSPLCALSVGDGYEFDLRGAIAKKEDGADVVVGECVLDADTGLHLSGVVVAPVTLPPVDPSPPPLDVAKGWGVGGFGTASAAGWAAGAVVALPAWRFHLFGPREVAAQLGAGGGSAGFVSMASVIVR